MSEDEERRGEETKGEKTSDDITRSRCLCVGGEHQYNFANNFNSRVYFQMSGSMAEAVYLEGAGTFDNNSKGFRHSQVQVREGPLLVATDRHLCRATRVV